MRLIGKVSAALGLLLLAATGVGAQDVTLSVAVMPLVPVADPELVKLMLSLSEQPKAKTVDPTTLYDAGPFKRLVDSGFLKPLPVQQ